MKREKTIWFDTPGDFFSLLVKENYSLHSLREKSIIPNKSQSCCPLFSAVPSGTLGDVDFMSYALLCFFFKACLAGPAGGGVTLAAWMCAADSRCYLSRCGENVM